MLDEPLTVLALELSPRLRRSLATTNAAESLLSRARHVTHNVKRWRGGQMMLRWVAAGVLEAVKGMLIRTTIPRTAIARICARGASAAT